LIASVTISKKTENVAKDIERFDAKLFRRQVATVVQLTGELMTADLSTIRDDSGS
jgi:hypothetical protein